MVVDTVAVPLGVGERLQQHIEQNCPRQEEKYQQYPLPWLGVNNLHEVRKAHEVAIGVNNKRSSEVTSFDEEEGGVHPKDCGVGELEHGHQEGGENVLTFPDPLDHVMKVSHPKEERANDDGPELRVVT